MDDDADDYMSDKFLLEAGSKSDVRPGLITDRNLKRNHEMSKKRDRLEEEKKKKLSVKGLEQVKLMDGLDNPIPAENKGFSLLQKMGFNPGSGLGKSGEGRLEPVPIKIKNDRVGLGRETVIKEVKERMKTMKKQKQEMMSTEKYRAWRREQFTEKLNSKDLAKSQRICSELDIKQGINTPEVLWFWPEPKSDELENETEEDKSSTNDAEESESPKDAELSVSEKLQLLTIYLRGTHLHCIWCGTQYNDEEDLSKNCPGPTREDHD